MQPAADRDSSKLFQEVLHLNVTSQLIVKHLNNGVSPYHFRISDPQANKKALRLACSAGRAAIDSAIFRVAPNNLFEHHPNAASLLTANWDVRQFRLNTAFWPRDVLSPFLHLQKRLETLVLEGFMRPEFVDALMTTQLPALTNLELCCVSWDSTPSKPLAALPFLPQLRRLKVERQAQHCYITLPLPPGIHYDTILGLKLPLFLPSCISLEVLDFHGSNDDVFSAIIRISLPRLREFQYAANFREYNNDLRQNLNSVSVSNIWPSLKKLCLQNLSSQDQEGQNTQTILAYMNCFADVDGINDFTIADRKLRVTDMPTVLNVPWCSNLTSLQISGSGCLMDDDAASCFAQVDWKNLQRLEIGSGFVYGSGFSKLHMPSLTYFGLKRILPEPELFSIPVCNQLTHLRLDVPFFIIDGDYEQEEQAWFSNLLQTASLSNLEHLEIVTMILLETAVEMANVGYGKMPALKSLKVVICDCCGEVDIIASLGNINEFSFFLDALKGSAPRQVVTAEDF